MKTIEEFYKDLKEFNVPDELFKELISSVLKVIEESGEDGYREGYKDACRNYAIWRNGKQYMGVLQTPLDELLKTIDESEVPIQY